MNKREERIEKQFQAYSKWVEQYAEDVFWERIQPWLEKYHLVFGNGMGDYYIHYTDQTPTWFVKKYSMGYSKDYPKIDKDKIDRRIYDILESRIEGMPGNSLGTIMPNYKGD